MVGSPISLLGIVNPNEIQSALNSLIIQLNEIFNSETSEASLTVANLTVSQSLTANVSGNISLNATGAVSLSPTGALTINPTAASAIDNCALGVTVPLAVKSTTLTATGAVALSPAGANVVLSPTTTGLVTIAPNTAGSIDNMTLGVTTPLAVKSTTLTATGAVALSPVGASVVISPTTTGVVTIAPNTAGTINNCSLGATTPLAVTSTTLTATGAVALSPASLNVVLSPTGTGVVTINPATAGTMDNVAIGATTALAGKFTTLAASGVATFTSQVAAGQGALTVASGANAVLDTLFSGVIAAGTPTHTVTGGTNITNARGFNVASIYQQTITDSTPITISSAASLFVDGPPIAAGSVTITNAYAFWVRSGTTNVQALVSTGITVPGVTAPLLSTTGTITTGAGAQVGTLTNSPTAGNPTKWWPINDNGTTRYVPAW